MHLPADNSDEAGPSQAAKPFLAHLDDLRWSLVHSLLALCAGMLVAVPFAPMIRRWLEWPLRRAGQDPASLLRTLEVAGGFAVAMACEKAASASSG